MAILRVVKGGDPGTTYPLMRSRVLLGRSPSCDIVLHSDSVSRQHAAIEFDGHAYVIEDLGSQNGTAVNGHRIDDSVQLEAYDRIQIHSLQFVFELTETDRSSPPGNTAAPSPRNDEPDDSSWIDFGSELVQQPEISSSIELVQQARGSQDGGVAARLDAVLTIMNDLARAIDLSEILPKLMASLLRIFRQADSACLVLRQENRRFYPAATRRRDGKKRPARVSRTVLQHALNTKSALLSNDAALDERFSGSDSVAGIHLHSLMCVPLLDHEDQVIGLLQLDAPATGRHFDETDLDLLAGITRMVAIVVENARLQQAAVQQLVESNRRLEDSQALYLSLVEQMPMCLFRTDLNGRLVYVNRPYCELQGKPADELLGNNSRDLFPPHLAEKYDADDRRVLESGEPLRDVEEHRDGAGRTLHVEFVKSPVRDHNGQTIGLQGLFWDVTDRIAGERALRASEERFRSFLDNTPSFTYMKDARGRYVMANGLVRQLFVEMGIDPLGKTDHDLFPREVADQLSANDRRVLETGASETFEESFIRDGERRTSLSVKFPLRDAENNSTVICGVSTDITDFRRAEESLRRAARLTSIGTLAAGIAHEINNPVAAALAAAETGLVVLDQPESQEMVRRCLENVVSSSRRCSRIIGNVLKFSRNEETEKEVRDLNGVVKSAHELAASIVKRLRARVDVVLCPQPLPVVINTLEVEQVLVNLLQNAAQSGDGVQIVMKTFRDGLDAAVSITDNGRGMAEDERERMFDPFFTTRQQSGGSGLGLSIVHGIVNEYGGTIEVDSTPGAGTTLTIRLPGDGRGSLRGPTPPDV